MTSEKKMERLNPWNRLYQEEEEEEEEGTFLLLLLLLFFFMKLVCSIY